MRRTITPGAVVHACAPAIPEAKKNTALRSVWATHETLPQKTKEKQKMMIPKYRLK